MRNRILPWLVALAVPLLAPLPRALAGDGPPPSPPASPGPGSKDAPEDSAPDAGEKKRVSAAKSLAQGDLLREEGKWAAAAKAYGHSLDDDESQYLAHVRYQEAVIAIGDASSLPAEYDAIVKDRPTDANARLHRLRCDLPAPRLDALNALLKASPGDPAVLLETGRAQLATGDAAGARKSLDAAYAVRPDLADLLELSTEAMRRSGDLAAARARLDEIVKAKPDAFESILRLAVLDVAEGKNEDAAKRAEAVLGMRPSYVAAFLVRSEACSRIGKTEDARTALDSALRIRPEDGDTLVAIADLTARGANEEGLKKAVDLYKKVLTLRDAPQLRAFYGLGWAEERLNHFKEAAEAYREASLLSPSDAGVVNSVGVVLMKQKSFQPAIVQFKKAIDIDPKSPEAYCNLGAVADLQGDWNEGIKWYEKVLTLKGQDKNVRALLAGAFDHEALSQYKRAEEMLQKVREIRPDDSEVAFFLGDNQFFQKKYKSAIKAYQVAVKLNEKNRYGWRGLGISLAQDEKPQDAVDALEKAKALKADDQPTLLILGDLYLNDIEDLDKALENYKAYVKAGGNNPDVPRLIEEIQKEIDAKKK